MSIQLCRDCDPNPSLRSRPTLTESLLAQLVEHKRVAVIANNPDYYGFVPDADIVVRFNSDPTPNADIWCSAFYGEFNQGLHDACSLVIASYPDGDAVHASLHYRIRDVGKEWFPRISKPIEFVPLQLWQSLCRQCESVPLTGLVMIAMLSQTAMSSCTVYGFSFHRNKGYASIRSRGYIGAIHKAIPNIRMLRHLAGADPRIKVEHDTDLRRIYWGWQIDNIRWLLYDGAKYVLRPLKRILKPIVFACGRRGIKP